MYLYLIVSGKKFQDNLGHEIFITRKIALLLLLKGIINKSICIVSSSNDRKFLYDNIFDKFLTYDTYISLNIDNKSSIDISNYLGLWLFTSNWSPLNILYYENISKDNECYLKHGNITNGLYKILNTCDIYKSLNKHPIFDKYSTDEFNLLNCNMNLLYTNINKEFFILHIRNKLNNIEINTITNFINRIKIPCIIFSVLSETYNFPCIYKVNNLQSYASLLNSKLCKFLLSEWSGGGQIGQFCTNNIFYYFKTYNSPEYMEYNFNYFTTNNNNDFFNNWDFFNPYKSDCNISKNLEEACLKINL